MKTEIDCSEFEQRINDLLDQRMGLEHCYLLQRHAAHCSDCSELLDHYRQVAPLLMPADPTDHFVAEYDKLNFRSSNRLLRKSSRFTFKRNDYQKFTWSVAPCFAALLMVAVGMLFAPLRADKNLEFAWASNQERIPGTLELAVRSDLPVRLIPHESLQFSPIVDLGPSYAEHQFRGFYEDRIDPWQRIFLRTPDFFGIHSANRSLQLTFGWLQQSLVKPTGCELEFEPDLGLVPTEILTSLV